MLINSMCIAHRSVRSSVRIHLKYSNFICHGSLAKRIHFKFSELETASIDFIYIRLSYLLLAVYVKVQSKFAYIIDMYLSRQDVDAA